MSLGYVLKKFREERQLSLREFGHLSDVDHVYIHRLEKEERTSPSEQIISGLARTLKLSKRQADILRLVVGQTINEQLLDAFIEDKDLPLHLLVPLANMSFRGKRPKTKEDWRKQAERLKQFLEDK